jgi:hypothetical protein
LHPEDRSGKNWWVLNRITEQPPHIALENPEGSVHNCYVKFSKIIGLPLVTAQLFESFPPVFQNPFAAFHAGLNPGVKGGNSQWR